MSRTFMTLTFDLNIKIIFSPWIWVWQNVFALWHRHTKFWHMGVSPWHNMLCTFLTLVWPWPLTYMRVAGGILSEFYSQFLSCFFFSPEKETPRAGEFFNPMHWNRDLWTYSNVLWFRTWCFTWEFYHSTIWKRVFMWIFLLCNSCMLVNS